MNFDNKLPEWKNNGTEPSDKLKNDGFSAGYKPPANIFNWFWSKVIKAITELQTKLTSEETARKNADTTLHQKINTEATTRANADAPMREFMESTAFYTDTVNLTEITSLTVLKSSDYSVGDVLYIHNTDTSNIDYLASDIDPRWDFSEMIVSGQIYKVKITKLPVGGADMEYGVITVLDNLTLRYKFNDIENVAELLSVHENQTNNPHNVTKSQVGLSNCDNTSDANKPISTATQTALDAKQDTIKGGASTITSSNLTANRALVSNASGKVAVSAVTSTELGYLDGVTGNVQTQLNGKQAANTGIKNEVLVTDGNGKIASSGVSTIDLQDAIPIAIGLCGFETALIETAPLVFEFGEEFNFTGIAQYGGDDIAVNHMCSGDEYDTGKVWLDGSSIYRKDFNIKITNSTILANGYIEITDDGEVPLFPRGSRVINYSVSSTHSNNACTLDSYQNLYEIRFEPASGYSYIVITGFVEYVKDGFQDIYTHTLT